MTYGRESLRNQPEPVVYSEYEYLHQVSLLFMGYYRLQEKLIELFTGCFVKYSTVQYRSVRYSTVSVRVQ